GPHLRCIGIKNADTRLGARARTVPDRTFARDFQLRLVGHLRRRVVGELLRLRVVAHRRAVLPVVAEPDVALVLALRIVRPGDVDRDLRLGHLAALRVDPADDTLVVDAVPDAVLQVDARAADAAGLRQRLVLGELVGYRIVFPDARVAAEERHPDVALAVDVYAVGRGRVGGSGEELHLARLPVPLEEAVAADHRRPDVALRVDYRGVRLQRLLHLAVRVER